MSAEPKGQMSDLADAIQEKKRALKVSDVAELLSVSERQIYKLAAEQVIPSFRIGGSLRFDPQKTADWLRQQMKPSPFEFLRQKKHDA